jgi:hypothetical protein
MWVLEPIKGNHNPKVGGSNPSPATKNLIIISVLDKKPLPPAAFYVAPSFKKTKRFQWVQTASCVSAWKIDPGKGVIGVQFWFIRIFGAGWAPSELVRVRGL